MKNIIFLPLVITAIFALGTAAKAADSDLCQKANAGLESFLQQAPKTCTADADCGGFYYRTGACGRAIVLRNDHATPEFLEELQKKQQLTGDACPPEFSHRATCEAQPFKAACVQGMCVDISPNP